MGISKKQLFTREQNKVAEIARIISHPARVAILQYLVNQDRCINTDLVRELGLAQATISQHLRELKDAGLIRGTIEGVSINYCIHAKQWESFKAIIITFLQQIDCSKRCC